MIDNLVSIIIRTWNRSVDLRETLCKLDSIAYRPIEIIVVDNGSQDNTAEMVSDSFPSVKVIKLKKNLGVEATNIGIRQSQGEYVIVLDDDAFFMPGIIEAAITKFKRNDKLGILAFKIVDFYTRLSPQTKFDRMVKSLATCNNGILVKVFQGGGFMMLRRLFDIVGGYPDDFFFVGEESDLAFRVLAVGWEIRYFPNLAVIHKPSPRSRSVSRKTYFEVRNIIWLYWKYSPLYLAFLKTCITVIYLGIKSLLNFSVVSFLRGFFDGIRMLPKQFKKRQVICTQTTVFFIKSALSRLRTNT